MNPEDIDTCWQAVNAVMEKVNARKTETQGTGTIDCPKCGGTLSYSFSRNPRSVGRGRQTVAGRCERADCITFSGH